MKSCAIPTQKTVAAFKDYDFENCDVPEKYWGDYTHANFFRKYFIPIVRREIKAMAKAIGATVKFDSGYFEWSAFFSKNGKFIYVSTSDHRWNNWYDDVLYRWAENDHDYHGGPNNFTSYDKLKERVAELLDR